MLDTTIEIIDEVIPHPNADRLDIAKVLGFKCAVPKGTYKGGERIVYIRPDTVLPDEDWAIPYKKYAPKRVKPIKLRGEWSEGIIMPFAEYTEVLNKKEITQYSEVMEIGSEVSNVLGIKHYEPPIPNDLEIKGYMPYYIPKTDEERWENLVKNLPIGEMVDVTLKIDGSSVTYYYHIGDDAGGVASRTLEVKPENINKYTVPYNKYNIAEKLKAYCLEHGISLAIRGEVYGMGIQGKKLNPHSKLPLDMALFSVYLIDERRYAQKGELHYYANVAQKLGLPSVPVIEENVPLTKELIDKYSTGIEKLNDVYFEGVVLKHANGSFKIINKYYDSEN